MRQSSARALLRPTGRKVGGGVFAPAAGYDLVARSYDRWYWQSFWEANEAPLVAREIDALPRGGFALDVGTGTGQYLALLWARHVRAVGLDVSMEMLRQARRRLRTSGIVCGAVESCPFRSEMFDVVVACRVLSHVSDLTTALSELGRITKRGGRAIIADVSSHHNYETTRIPTDRGDVHIETHKHSNEKIITLAVQSGLWSLQFWQDVHFRDLTIQPSPGEYPAIDESSRRPIFFYARLSRTKD